LTVVDTHVVFWLGQDPQLLSQRAREVLAEGRREAQLAIAGVTLREIAWVLASGRVTIPTSPVEYLRFVEARFRVVALDSRIAWRAVQFGPDYPSDPADREIGATAIVLGAKLVTKDRRIRASGEVDCIW
jgi:PIN domain nuclease of toxin-antitoxin system